MRRQGAIDHLMLLDLGFAGEGRGNTVAA